MRLALSSLRHDAQAGGAAWVALWFWQQPPVSFESAPSGGGRMNFFLMLLQTLLALALVCGIAYAIFRWILPRLAVARSSNSMVHVVDRINLDARKSLYIIEVAGRWMLIASSEAGVHLVSELDAATAAEAADEVARQRPTFGASSAAVRSAFADRLAQIINKKGS